MTELGEFAMYLALGFTSLGVFFGPIGAAVARRITARATAAEQRLGAAPRAGAAELEELHARLEALESGQHRLAEVEERLDFAERLLAQREPERLEG